MFMIHLKMFKKVLILCVIVILVLVLAGCKVAITDFQGFGDLPKNPSKIVFATNSMNFDEETGLYGDPIEYEVKSENITEIIEILFATKYKAFPKNVAIDLHPIKRYLVLYNDEGTTWTVHLGLRKYNERWYYPINDDDLITILYESITI